MLVSVEQTPRNNTGEASSADVFGETFAIDKVPRQVLASVRKQVDTDK